MAVVEEVEHTGLENIEILEDQNSGGTVPFVGQGWEDTENLAGLDLAVGLGIVVQPLQPTDLSALMESQGPAG